MQYENISDKFTQNKIITINDLKNAFLNYSDVYNKTIEYANMYNLSDTQCVRESTVLYELSRTSHDNVSLFYGSVIGNKLCVWENAQISGGCLITAKYNGSGNIKVCNTTSGISDIMIQDKGRQTLSTIQNVSGQNVYFFLTDDIIPDGMFSGLTSLTSITISPYIKTIGSNAFSGCTNISSVDIRSLNNYAFNCVCTNIGSSPFHSSPYATLLQCGVAISDLELNATSYTLTTLNNYCFYNCRSIRSLTLNVTYGLTLGTSSFNRCENLSALTINNSEGSIIIGSSTFAFCNFKTIDLNDVSELGNNAFYSNVNLANVTLSSNLSHMGTNVFYKSSNLKTIKCYATTVPTISSTTFNQIGSNGSLLVPNSSKVAYTSSWMQTSSYYLGYYNWSIDSI